MVTAEKPNKHVVFIHEASSSIGMGHILRSLVLARQMDLRGYVISGITIGDEKAVLFATERAKREQFVWPLRLARDSQQAIEFTLHAPPQLVVVDCSDASQHIVRACAASGIPTVALDYFIAELPLPAAIINLIDHNPSTLAGRPPGRAGADYHEGPRYAIIRNEFLEARERRQMRGERAILNNVVIAFGGADPAGNSQCALEMLARWPREFVVDLVIGPLFASKIENAIDDVSHKCVVRTHVSPSNIGVLFENADLVFCGGGGTLLEAICVGVPAVVIAQNGAELRHAESLAKRKACWISGEINWETVSSPASRKRISDCARECVDGRGSERICNVIEQQLA